MNDLLTYLANLAAAWGVWSILLALVGCVVTVISWFLFIVAARSGFWLWGRLPLWEAQNYRQAMMERGDWQDDEGETRLLHYAERQRRKWDYLLNGLIAEAIILVFSTALLLTGQQPVGWFVLGIGSVVVGLLVLTAWL